MHRLAKWASTSLYTYLHVARPRVGDIRIRELATVGPQYSASNVGRNTQTSSPRASSGRPGSFASGSCSRRPVGQLRDLRPVFELQWTKRPLREARVLSSEKYEGKPYDLADPAALAPHRP